MLGILNPGCTQNPHVLCVRSGSSVQSGSKLPAPITPRHLRCWHFEY
ncbi:L-asparaginase [Rahnella variigena]|nr:L-asparaginase [Rahnella variigena]